MAAAGTLKPLKYEETIVKHISDQDIDKLENRTIISGGYFLDSKCSFDFMNLSNDTKPSIFIWRSVGDDDRVFFKYTLSLSNGKTVEDCCWNCERFH